MNSWTSHLLQVLLWQVINNSLSGAVYMSTPRVDPICACCWHIWQPVTLFTGKLSLFRVSQGQLEAPDPFQRTGIISIFQTDAGIQVCLKCSLDLMSQVFWKVCSLICFGVVRGAASGFRRFSEFPPWNNAASPVREIHNNERTACAVAAISGVPLHSSRMPFGSTS